MFIIGVFLNPAVRTGGHRRYLEFFQSAADKGHTVCLILNKELIYNFNSIKEIRVKTKKKSIIPYSLKFKSYVQTVTKNNKSELSQCDYIVIHGETHLLAGIALKKQLNAKLLFALRSNGVVESQMKRTESDTSLKDKVKLTRLEHKYRTFEKIISKNSDTIAFQSAFDRDSFLSRNSKPKGSPIIVNGNIGGDWFDSNYRDKNSSNQVKNLIFVGAYTKRKGIIYLIEAFIKLRKDGYKVRLVILGEGNLKPIMEEQIRSNNLEQYVDFEGKVSNPLDYIVKADLNIVSSVFDSFPDVILESLHVGTPVIAASSGGMPEMLDNKDIFNVADANAIYNKVKHLIDEPDEYKKMQSRLIKNRERFDFDWTQAFINEMK